MKTKIYILKKDGVEIDELKNKSLSKPVTKQGVKPLNLNHENLNEDIFFSN